MVTITSMDTLVPLAFHRGRCSSAGARHAAGLSGMALLSPRLVPALRALSPRDTIGLLRLGINPEVCGPVCYVTKRRKKHRVGCLDVKTYRMLNV